MSLPETPSIFDGPYERRCVLFMDILGFRALIENGEEDKIWRILQTANRLAYDPPEELKGIEITSFSDSLVISAPMTNKNPVEQVCTVGTQLVLEFIDETIMTRGAIVIGDLHHSGAIVFGPALNAAYDYESSLAKYPRIVVTDEVIDEETKETDSFFKDMFTNQPFVNKVSALTFRRDFDGIFHLNIFTPFFEKHIPTLIARKKRTSDDYTKAISRIMETKPKLPQGKVPSANHLNIAAKYDWLVTYFASQMLRNEELIQEMFPDEDKDPFDD